jgi:hypothetical protein
MAGTPVTDDGGSGARRVEPEVPPADSVDTESSDGSALGIAPPLLALVGNVTAIAGLLFYFGWKRTATQDYLLGLAPELFRLSAHDYVLRSVGPILRLLAVVSVLGLAAVYLDRWLWRRVDTSGAESVAVAWLLRLSAVAWIALPALTFAMNKTWPSSAAIYIAFPLSIGCGVLLLLYRDHVLRKVRRSQAPGRGARLLERSAAAMLVAVSLFWAAANYAEVDGVRAAYAFIRDSHREGQVVVYSERRLSLGNAVEEPLPSGNSAYNYRYTGLWLMVYSGGNYFLVGEDWTPSKGKVVILPGDDHTVRVEFGN